MRPISEVFIQYQNISVQCVNTAMWIEEPIILKWLIIQSSINNILQSFKQQENTFL
jgi:hypothetical protein